ncbi:calcium-binding protein [Phenylobacterium sp.]|uniref:calcium-binding protein n=1 Tax=Phenylobacterium sp. TaxID=1871053 RepID=UPI002BD674E6|nr:calcium-binding protein [Phenylobacterium sp.]HVI33393.1 calcium-binding protein [Phenylobacterium sp.]
MPTYAFETITAEQAIAIAQTDRVTVSSGSARQTTILYLPDGAVTMIVGDHSVTFGANLSVISRQGGLTFQDGTTIYIGDDTDNGRDQGAQIGSGAIYGGAGDDEFTAARGAFLIQGNQGSDTIWAHANSSNTIYGGQGNDHINFYFVGGSPAGQNFVQGNKGLDTIQGSTGNDTLLGGQGDDRLSSGGGVDFINGNLGNDYIEGSGLLLGEDGADVIVAGTSGVNSVRGGDGDDRITASSLSSQGGVAGAENLIWGDQGNDVLISLSPERDELFGGVGDDTIQSQGNRLGVGDLLDGGDGNDSLAAFAGGNTLSGGEGNDTLSGGPGASRLEGGVGIDLLTGGTGADFLFGGDGGDTISDPGGQNVIDGGGGGDHITVSGPGAGTVAAGDGDDTVTAVDSHTVEGGLGNDKLTGGSRISGDAGDDTLAAGAASTVLDGDAGLDSLLGNTGNDTLSGGDDADTLSGGRGADALSGGAGADVFVFGAGDNGTASGQPDRILDWAGADDRISFQWAAIGTHAYGQGTAADYASAISHATTVLQGSIDVVAIQVGADVVIFADIGGANSIGSTVVLVGRTLASLDSSNIL